MKNIIRTIAIAFLASTLVFTNSEAKTIDPVTPKSFNVGMYNIVNSLKMKVLVEKTTGSYVEINFINEKGEVLFTQITGKKETLFAKVFNLENLEDGKYRFEVKSGSEKIVKEVNISSKALSAADYRTINVQ